MAFQFLEDKQLYDEFKLTLKVTLWLMPIVTTMQIDKPSLSAQQDKPLRRWAALAEDKILYRSFYISTGN